MTAPNEDFRHWAFISYSHADAKCGDWLHARWKLIASRAVVRKAQPPGAVPRRVFPVFRDREELASSASLGENIENALRTSRALCRYLLTARRHVALGQDPARHHLYSTAMGLLALLEVHAADAPWDGSKERRDQAGPATKLQLLRRRRPLRTDGDSTARQIAPYVRGGCNAR